MNSPALLILSVRFVVSYIFSTTIPAAAAVESYHWRQRYCVHMLSVCTENYLTFT